MKTRQLEALAAWNQLDFRRADKVFDADIIPRLLIRPDDFVAEVSRADMETLEPVFNLEVKTIITDEERTVETTGCLLDYSHLTIDDKEYLAMSIRALALGASRMKDWLTPTWSIKN